MYKCLNCPFCADCLTPELLNVAKLQKHQKNIQEIHSWFHYLILIYLLMRVATTSKQMSWLFWNNFTNGNAKSGRYGVSLKMADQ